MLYLHLFDKVNTSKAQTDNEKQSDTSKNTGQKCLKMYATADLFLFFFYLTLLF